MRKTAYFKWRTKVSAVYANVQAAANLRQAEGVVELCHPTVRKGVVVRNGRRTQAQASSREEYAGRRLRSARTGNPAKGWLRAQSRRVRRKRYPIARNAVAGVGGGVAQAACAAQAR